jgi:ligand-binding sensor domain-containing protein/signal transduction histidine kinase
LILRIRIQNKMVGSRWLTLALALVLAGATATAVAASEWTMRVWQSGLADDNITGIDQTPDGYLWLASPSRLRRFDGVRFETLAATNFPGNNMQSIRLSLHTRDGSLWLAMAQTKWPAIRLHGGAIEIFTNEVSGNSRAQSMMEDMEGGVWIAYADATITRVKDGHLTSFKAMDVDPGISVYCSLACGTNGRVWLACSNLVGEVRGGRFESLLRLPDKNYRLAPANGGGIWICSGYSLFKYSESGDLQSLGNITPTAVRLHPSANALLEDRDGAVWIGTSSIGLFRYDGSQFEIIPTSHRGIVCLMDDHEGNIWVGTSGSALNRVRRHTIELEYTDSESLFQSVQSICEGPGGVMWAATQNSELVCRTNGDWEVVSTNGTWWPGARVASVAMDHSGASWFGTSDHKLYRLRDGKLRNWGQPQGLEGRSVNLLLVTRSGDLWMANQFPYTVQCIRAGTDTLQSFPGPTHPHRIRALIEDAAGDVWVGRDTGELWRIHGNEVIDITNRPPASMAQSWIRSMYGAPDGSVWIGYTGAGLGRLKDGKLVMIGTDQGLFDDSIAQIIPDERGWLWFGANNGVFKVRQEELNALAEGRAPRVNSVSYVSEEGLQSLRADFSECSAAVRSRNGLLWIPMNSAVAVVHTDRVAPDTEPPPVHVERVSVNGRPFAEYGIVRPTANAVGESVVDLRLATSALRLPADCHKLEIEFTALSFSAPENVRFKYRLEGYDEDWIDGGTARSATYSHLPAGNYRFRVKACNSEWGWNETGSGFDFIVAQFFWQTWWFQLLAAVVFSAVIFALVRFISLRRLHRKLQAIEQQAALDRSHMAGMSEVATNVLHNVGNVLNSVNISGSMVGSRIRESRVAPGLSKAGALLKEHEQDLGQFMATPQGKQLASYLTSLGTHLATEQKENLTELDYLKENVDRITEIIVRQQRYTGMRGIQESFNVVDVVEDAIRMNTVTEAHTDTELVREFPSALTVKTDRHKVLQIISNLIANAHEALDKVDSADKRIVVRVEAPAGDTVKVTVVDTGIGIPAENISRIFHQRAGPGKDGGIGLHTSAIAARELGGTLTVESPGPGQGATFVLQFPAAANN